MNINQTNLKLKIGFNGRPFCQDKIRGLARHSVELIKHLKKQHPEIEVYIYSNRVRQTV